MRAAPKSACSAARSRSPTSRRDRSPRSCRGQAATVFEHGKPGLSLSGSGTFNPIEHGKPRASSIERVPVPKSGLSAPRNAANGHAIHALGPIDKGAKAAAAPKPSQQAAGVHAPKGGAAKADAAKPGVVRISSSLGEVKLNVHKVTHGLAHGGGAPGQARNSYASTETVWGDSKAGTTASNGTAQTAVTTSSGVTAGTSSSAASTTIAATTAGASSDGSGGGNGDSGGKTKPDKGKSGNGNSGSGNSGNGNGNNGATGNGRGNNGNGNGNGGGNGSNGHGNALGHNKH
ncbi:hypothetical protein ACVWZ6_007210 [Bradyrhizobium sp. GM6.1]